MKNFCKKHNITEKQFLGEEKIGGSLYLSSLTSIPEGFNPTVGRYLITKNKSKMINSNVKPVSINKNFFWRKNNKTYALIDSIFCEILNEKVSNDNTIFKANRIGKENEFFIVKKENYYSHGEDLHKAIEDLNFKIASEKLKKEPILEDTIMTIDRYRIITGACEFGVKEWIKANNIKSNEILAKDLLPLLEKTNAYGLDKFKKLIKF